MNAVSRCVVPLPSRVTSSPFSHQVAIALQAAAKAALAQIEEDEDVPARRLVNPPFRGRYLAGHVFMPCMPRSRR